ncbi:hypothetical protein [Streptomyces pacificus]|uniref:Restriction endonuclease type IV Mrr domain-containing protein n=1 Tax=Streptomyces pacificus TaxID=2705029 RepID=A0A6A0AYI4_9ACTN|nr:hypothetical protein [Streptomyces pacificus]GFH37463.1 hypothetical protein SCWH03_37010 [Streptomyces pacificus]
MTDHVPVRCPVCRRAHTFASPVYPCACGAPLAPPLLQGAPAEPIRHRTWTDDWVTVRCPACGRQDQWPQPELGCPCGTVLRIPVRPVTAMPETSAGAAAHRSTATAAGAEGSLAPSGTGPPGGAGAPGSAPFDQRDPGPADPAAAAEDALPLYGPGGPEEDRPFSVPAPASARPDFRPTPIRTARDAVTAAARYLRWLGFQEIVQPEERTASGVDLRALGLVAQVDPTTRPVTLRAVECLWLSGLSSSASSVLFSLAGYSADARARADGLGVPLFAMDLTGAVEPVNGPAKDLASTGA